MIDHLNRADYTVIIVYFALLVGMGLVLRRMAAASLEDYFLGGRKLPWWALGTSGMASFLDMTGTMLIVSFLYMLGPRGLFIEFRGGAVLVLVFMLLWTGKWHRRSNCMTGAEWQVYRFGSGPGGQFARVVTVIAAVVSAIGMLAYLIKGAGLFLSMFLPWPPLVCAAVMIVIATVYTMVSGFYGVVFTDLFQSLIVLVAVVGISTMAILAVASFDGDLGTLAEEVTGSPAWTESTPHWTTPMPRGYEQYSHLFMFAMFYLFRNILGGLGSGGDPKYFAARSERECGLLTFLWTWLMMFRWPMMMGFAVLGLFLVRDLFPDQSVLDAAAVAIKQHIPNIEQHRWEDVLAGITPQAHPELAVELAAILGEDWQTRLKLVSFEGTVNPERILPAVLLFEIPAGFRGLLLVTLIAASMSTFDSTVNGTTAFFTRDCYQAYLRPRAGNRELIFASYIFGAVLVAVAFAMGYFARNINEIWGWIIMGLGTGLAIPGILRLYWWRFNASGLVTATLTGLTAALAVRAFYPGLDERIQFLLLTAIGLTAAVGGTYLFPPTDRLVLERFYRTTRPFGLWGPLKQTLDPDTRATTSREHFYDVVSVPFAFGWQITLFLIPMLLIIGNYPAMWLAIAIFAVCLTGLYLFWYRNLPPAGPVPAFNPTAVPESCPGGVFPVAIEAATSRSDATAQPAPETES